MGFQRQRIWDEKPLSDSIKPSLLSTPDERMILSTTSNVQMEPCCIVLLDHKYPIIGVTSVTVHRSRRNESNTASISIVNINSRYSGPNKSKIAANTPVSIYMGYSKRYMQRFEGFIDTTSMVVTENSCTIQIECRDKAKPWIENKDISCGIYSEKSDYMGEYGWHYKVASDGVRLPRPWTHEEVLRDVCYVLGLKDIVPYVYIEEVDQGNGFYDYVRHINYEAEYKITIDPKWESDLVCNFVEENALDVLSKLAQSIFHEVFFDQQGKLIVRPVKSASDDAVFYFKEERDIIELSQNINDDDIANIITVIGQTANETAVIYPFCAVAQSDMVTLDKGQDLYGYQLKYPKVVARENVGTLQNPSLYAHTIAPNAEPVADYKDNPENKPSYDFMIHFPNFSQSYEKQIVLDASCPIITDEALMANTTNLRTWNFYGEVDTAVSYEKQPIMLKDRFNKDILVVCKERSMDDATIKQCGGHVYNPEKPEENTDEDEWKPPVNIPTVYDHYKFETNLPGYNYLHENGISVPDGSPAIPPGISTYDGIEDPPGTWSLVGYKPYERPASEGGGNALPSSASGKIPAGFSVSDFDGKGFTLDQFVVVKGTSPYPGIIDDSVFDTAALSTIANYIAVVEVQQTVEVHNYTGGYMAVPGGIHYTQYVKDPTSAQAPAVIPHNFIASLFGWVNLNALYIGCSLNTSSITSSLQLTDSGVTPFEDLPSSAMDMGLNYTVNISYPLLFVGSNDLTSSSGSWNLQPINSTWHSYLQKLWGSFNKRLEVYTATIDSNYVSSSNPDANCIFWRWFGTFERKGTQSSLVPPLTGQDLAPSAQGQDAEGNPRVLITKEAFYRLAAEPHTVVIECTTAGIDHKSWAEVVKFDENQLIVKGHNLYGSMRDAYKAMLEKIQEIILAIGAIITFIGLLIATHTHTVITSMGSGLAMPSGQGFETSAMFTGTVVSLLGVLIMLYGDSIDTNVGQNVSKVMEDLTGRVTACRRPEIELFEAGWCQSAQWVKRIAESGNVPNGVPSPDYTSMRYSGSLAPSGMFGYIEGITVDQNLTDAFRTKQEGTDISRNYCWVYIIDLTKPGPNGVSFPNGAMLTSFGWETPEVGDRNPWQYYTGVNYHDYFWKDTYTYPTSPSRLSYTTRYAIEAFRDDPSDSLYTADYLLALRFENKSLIRPKTNETWWDSRGYELLVDRSMSDVSITDAGIWHDFWERRDDYSERRYKYVALVVYSWKTQTIGADGVANAGDGVESVTFGSTPSLNIFANQRWGIFIPRGLNLGWYNKFRWLEKNNPNLNTKVEQNYITTQIVFQGQELLIADLYNNFKYSSINAQIRVWGKPFGTYAPTIVYYKEVDPESLQTYGDRQIEIRNACINDFRTARRLANMLTAQSNESFSMQTTGKPYIYEGEVVMVKEENSGAIAGVFRDWENIWKDPEIKSCTWVANQLATKSLTGVYFPQCAVPSVNNYTLIACSDGSRPTYLVEVDHACNPVWYMIATTNSRPTFVVRYEQNNTQYTILGTADGTVQKIDYTQANVLGTLTFPSAPLCGDIDEEQLVLWVGTSTTVYAIDLPSFTIKFISSIGGTTGIAAANWLAYDEYTEQEEYRELGLLFTVGTAGIRGWQIYSDRNRTNVGSLLLTIPAGTEGCTFSNPGSLDFDKHTGDLIYVNRSNASEPASIWGFHIEVDLDPQKPGLGIVAEMDQLRWKIDYMNDVELTQTIPNPTARANYINQFFQPVYAVYDVNKSLLISDSENNRVYKLNPSGKFYITEITDQFDISDDAAAYKQSYSMVAISAAASLQLTNFGRNYITTKTREEITAKVSTTMGRIVEVKGKEKYLVKLLSSDTTIEAINSSGAFVTVRDTVIVMMGLNGDTSGVGTIIAKKALNDWTIETGSPYVYTDATTSELEITKYGIMSSESGNGVSSTADLSAYNSRIRVIEQRLRILAGLHGFNW